MAGDVHFLNKWLSRYAVETHGGSQCYIMLSLNPELSILTIGFVRV